MRYSLVIPVFNNENGLHLLMEAISSVDFLSQDAEIIFVDDDSLDKSWEKLKALKAANNQLKIIRLSRNFGQHGATLAGINESNGDYILTIDDDLEVHPVEFIKLISEQSKTCAEVVYGEYTSRESFFRKVVKVLYKTLSKAEGRLKGKGSSMRLIQGNLARKIAKSHYSFVFIDEFLLWYTHEVEFVPVEKNKNQRSVSRYSTFDLFQKTSHLIMYSSDFPLKLVTYLGFIMSSTNLLIGLFFMYRKFIDKITEVGYASLIVSVLFSTGLIIFSLGILSQYVRKILRNQNNEPLYYISEKEC